MAVATKSKPRSTFKAKANQLVDFARRIAGHCANSAEFFNAIYGGKGMANDLFPSEPERNAFLRSKQCKEIRKIKLSLPKPPVMDAGDFTANGHLSITLRLPKSVHAALMAEAAAEGVSLDQLCLSKLVAQLRELV